MSSHFNYEINEAKLRERLTTMENSSNEEAWRAFQEFSSTNPLTQRRNVIPAFRINLNRNLVLPFVFGTIIIGFSFLLFNFVSIKKPQSQVADARPPQPKPVEKSEVKKPIAPAVVKKDTVKVLELPATASVQAQIPATLPASTTPVAITPSVTSQVQTDHYISNTGGNIFVSPNKASEVVGHFNAGKAFKPIEETVYFVKVSDGNITGFIMKSQLHKNGTTVPQVSARKTKKAEILQSNQTPFMTASEEKEPELR